MKLSLNTKTLAFVVSCALSTSTFANDYKQQEKQNELIGLGSGAVIGTLIAGPLGGILASVFGVLIAEDVNSDKKIARAELALQQKDQTLLSMQRQYEQAKQVAMIKIASLDRTIEQTKPRLESNIQFKTGSYVLQDHYKSQLDLVAQTLNQHPKLSVSLAGYADQRGDNNFNQSLSEKRAQAVREYLLNKNVNKKQVLTSSYGESTLVSSGASFEDDFFDRRVHIKVADHNAVMTAAN